MKVNGYKLRNAIQNQCHRREVLAAQFKDSLKVFPEEQKEHPSNMMEVYAACEGAIAMLQVAQTMYNSQVRVEFDGQQVPLLFVIKAVGGMGRIEKMWRTSTPREDPYGYRETGQRSKEHVYAEAQMSPKALLEASKAAAKKAAAAREAIAVGNATELDIDVDPALFE
jgi:hypothetical protein